MKRFARHLFTLSAVLLLLRAVAGCAATSAPEPRLRVDAKTQQQRLPSTARSATVNPRLEGVARTSETVVTPRLEVINLETGESATFDGTTVRVETFDSANRPVTWSRELSPAEQAFLSERINQAPFEAGPTRYENPDVWDGLRLIFNIQPAGKNTRGVYVANRFVRALAELSEALDVLMPPEHRIRYRQWQEESEGSADHAE